MELTDNEKFHFKFIFVESSLFKSFIDDGQDYDAVINELGLMVKTKYSLNQSQIYELYKHVHNSYPIYDFDVKTIRFYLEIMRFIGYDDLNGIIDGILDNCSNRKIKKLLDFDIIQTRLPEQMEVINDEVSRLTKIACYKPETMHDNLMTRINQMKIFTDKYDKLSKIQFLLKKYNETNV